VVASVTSGGMPRLTKISASAIAWISSSLMRAPNCGRPSAAAAAARRRGISQCSAIWNEAATPTKAAKTPVL
jgi:hypothetical protein